MDMTRARARLAELTAPTPVDQVMPVDFSRPRWSMGRTAAVAIAVVSVVLLLAAGLVLRDVNGEPDLPIVPGSTDLGSTGGSPEVGTANASSTASSAPAADAGGSDREVGPAGDPAAGPIVVSVVGLVHSPGVVELPAGSRIVDAVAAAGGIRPEADLASVNLAQILGDGQQVQITDRPMAATGGVTGTPAGGGAASGGTGSAGTGSGGTGSGGTAAVGSSPAAGLVNLNTATAAELDTLPGVGEATAAAILAFREAHGPFTTVDQLGEVDGIGPVKLGRLRELVVV